MGAIAGAGMRTRHRHSPGTQRGIAVDRPDPARQARACAQEARARRLRHPLRREVRPGEPADGSQHHSPQPAGNARARLVHRARPHCEVRTGATARDRAERRPHARGSGRRGRRGGAPGAIRTVPAHGPRRRNRDRYRDQRRTAAAHRDERRGGQVRLRGPRHQRASREQGPGADAIREYATALARQGATDALVFEEQNDEATRWRTASASGSR